MSFLKLPEGHQVRTTCLRFPEGPVWLADGSVLVVEIARGTVTRIDPSGGQAIVARPGGGPNGAALGPDGALYVCNNGGFAWLERGILRPTTQAEDYSGGRIERIDLRTGEVRVLYSACGDHPLRGPNDIVFDAGGGFYFTDIGKRRARDRDNGGLYYALPDGSRITEIVYPFDTPNGIGLSPDETLLFVAEMHGARLWAYDIISPGVIRPRATHNGARLVHGLSGYQRFDSLAVQANGDVCVATLETGCITVISAGGDCRAQVPTGDPHTTNLCFGGSDLRTAFVTLSGAGALSVIEWPEPGLKLNFSDFT